MSDRPVTVFSRTPDPAGVLDVLRTQGARVDTDGSGTSWVEGTATWSGGLFGRARTMRLRHSTDYYADESFAKQLPGMTGFLLRLPAPAELFDAVRAFRFAISLFVGTDDRADPRWKAALAVCQHLDGVIVLPTSFLDGRGRALVRTDGPPDPDAVAPAWAEPNPVLVPSGLDRVPDGWELPPYRATNVAALAEAGFRAPRWLSAFDRALRPAAEIAQRALALRALFVAIAADGAEVAESRRRLASEPLRSALTDDEHALLAEPVAQARNRVGWRLENLWPLAWALGFEPPPATAAGMIDDGRIAAVIGFLDHPSADDLLAAATPRTESEVSALQDRFLLAHHAVRSAQMGRATVPRGFHPAIDGGVIHERRHALTWMISPGVDWDDTELST
ncbi:MAG: DUF4272 domain-containing protein [Myxococcota bacterium]